MDELQILIKAILTENSEKNLDSQLLELTKKLGDTHKISLKVKIDPESVKAVQSELQTIAKQVSSASKESKAGGGQLKVFDKTQLQADGQKYFNYVRNIVARVQKEFGKMGKVDVTNVFKDAKGNIQSFTASVTKADGVVEKFNFELAKIKNGTRNLSGFVQTNSILSDRSAGSDLEKTLNFLNRIDTKIKDITSKTLNNTSKPLLGNMEQYNQYHTKLSAVKSRIEEIKKANKTLSGDHKREIASMVSDLQRYARELQKSAYAATDLNAATFANKKAELQAALQTDIQKWTNAGIFGGEFESAVNDAKTVLDNALDPTDLETYKHQLALLAQEFKKFKIDSSASGKVIDADTLNTNIKTAQQRILNLRETYSAFLSDPDLKSKWDSLFELSGKVDSKKALQELNAEIRNFEQELISAGKHSRSLFGELKANAVKMGTWMILGGVIAGIMRGFTGLSDAVVDLDSAMTELKKVTNETDEAYDKFLSNAADKAVEIGTAYADFVNSTASFARLGYTIEDSSKLAEVANIYAVVGDEISGVDEATTSIISTMKAFNIEADNALTIVDKFNEVGNNFAISSGGIGEAMQRSAAALASANNTIDQSIALIVAANNVIQDPDMVGTMWKTVSMRIRGATTELEQAGLETEYMAESTADLQRTVMALTNVDGLGGFDIMLDSKTFKSTYDIILGISKVWKDMSDIDQAALLELLAGKRQGNALAAALTNMKDAEAVLRASANAEGSAMEEHEKWMESIQAKQQKFQAQYEAFANSILSSNLIKGTYDVGTGLLGWLTDVSDAVGALPILFAAVTPFFDKLTLFRTTKKDNDSLGINTFWGAAKLDLEKDVRLLDEYNTKIVGLGNSTADLTKKQIAWNETIGKGTNLLKDSVKISDDATISANDYRDATKKSGAAAVAMGVKAKAAAVGVQILNAALNMLISFGVGLVINGIVSVFTSLSEKSKEAAEAAKENAEAMRAESDASTETRESVRSLIEEYDRLKENSKGAWSADEAEKLVQIQDQITELVGKQADNLDLVNGKIEEEYAKLLNIYGLLSQQEYDDAESYYRASQERLEAGYSRETNWHGASKEDDQLAYWYITKAYEQLHGVEQDIAQKWWGEQAGFADTQWLGDVPTALDVIGDYEDGLEKLYEWRRMLLDAEEQGFGYTRGDEWIDYDTADALGYLNSKISEFEEVVEEAQIAKDRFFSAKANQDAISYLTENDIDTQKAFDDYVMSIYNDDSISKDYAEALINTMHSYLPAFSIPDEVKRGFIADRDELINDVISEIPTADSSVIGEWLDKLSNDQYAAFVSWWDQNKSSTVVTESDLAMMDAFMAFMERNQFAFEQTAQAERKLAEQSAELKSAYDLLATAQEEMNSGSGLSVSTIQALAEANEDYLSYLYEENGAIKLNTDAWRENTDSKMQSEMLDIQREIAALADQNEKLRERNDLLAGEPVSDQNTNEIEENSRAIAENNTRIRENQSLLAVYGSLYGSITGDLTAHTQAANNFEAVANTIDSVATSYASLANLQKKVANGFTFSLDQILEYAKAYPKILESATITANGELALNETVVNSFIEGQKSMLDNQIDKQIAELEADKAVLLAKKELASAQLELAKAVINGESEMDSEFAAYKINLGNGIAEALIAMQIDEADAYRLATVAMAGNQEEFARVAAECFENVDSNAVQAAYDMANAFFTNSQNSCLSIADIAAQAHQTALAIAGMYNGEVSGSSQSTFNGAGGVYTGSYGFTGVDSTFNGVDFDYQSKTVSLDNYIANLEFDIADYEKAISQIDGHIATLQALKNTPFEKFQNLVSNASDIVGGKDTGSSGGSDSDAEEAEKIVEEYIAAIDQYYEALKRLEEAQERRKSLEKKLEHTDDFSQKIFIASDLVGAYEAEAEAEKNLMAAKQATIAANVGALRGLGFQVDYDSSTNKLFIKNLEHLNELTASTIGEYDTLQDATNALRQETEELIDVTEQLNDDNVAATETIEDLGYQVLETKKDIVSYIEEIYNQQVEAYREIIDLRKELIESAKDEYDYESDIADKVKEIAELQSRIDQLALDDSRSALAERRALEEELAELQDDLSQTQSDHSTEAQLEALDKLAEDYEKTAEEDIAILQNTVNATESVWSTFYDMILGKNVTIGDSVNTEIANAWLRAAEAVQAYGVSVNNLSGVGTVVGSIPKYHTGGVVTGSNVGNNELLAILEEGEVVFTKSQFEDLFANVRSSIVGVVDGILSRLAKSQPTITEVTDSLVNNNNSSVFNPQIKVDIIHNGDMTDTDAKSYGEKVADTAIGKLYSAFERRGISSNRGSRLKP